MMAATENRERRRSDRSGGSDGGRFIGDGRNASRHCSGTGEGSWTRIEINTTIFSTIFGGWRDYWSRWEILWGQMHSREMTNHTLIK